jgi:hypothetical protein
MREHEYTAGIDKNQDKTWNRNTTGDWSESNKLQQDGFFKGGSSIRPHTRMTVSPNGKINTMICSADFQAAAEASHYLCLARYDAVPLFQHGAHNLSTLLNTLNTESAANENSGLLSQCRQHNDAELVWQES